MAEEKVTGRAPIAEGWTTTIPASLQRMKMSEWLQRGRSTVVTRRPLEEGGGFAIKPRETQADRGQEKTREALRARFDQRDVREASMVDKEFIEGTEYDYSFTPAHSDVISLIEYSTKSWLLRVTFANNGSVVVYSKVPVNVFARLKYVEDSGQSVGAAFWDLIRIYERRGLPVGGPYYPKQSNFVREGGKYAFMYTTRGLSLGPRSDEYKVDYYDPMVASDDRIKRLTRTEREKLEAKRVREAEISGQILRMPEDKTRKALRKEYREEVGQLSLSALKAIQQAIQSSLQSGTGTMRLSKEDLDLLKK